MTSEAAAKAPRGLWGYNLAQGLILPFAALPAGLYFLSRRKYRGHFAERLGLLPGMTPSQGRPRIWVHALSLGEVNAAVPLLKAIRGRWPGAWLACSATTATGLEALRTRLGTEASFIFASPMDIRPVVERVLDRIRPDIFVLVETDIWPNWIWGLKRRGVPTLLVNGSISSKAARRLASHGSLARLLYGGFDVLGMQSEDDRARLVSLGLGEDRVRAPGNLKYDLDRPKRHRAETLREELGLGPGAPVLVAGSTHAGEEALILEAARRLRESGRAFRLILAPRNPGRASEVEALCREAGMPCVRRSLSAPWTEGAVFLLDTLGELGLFYGLSDLAFVGGSLAPVGGHNVLEPAAWGVPVLFGPHVESCREMASALLECGGGLELSANVDDLVRALDGLLASPSRRLDMGRRGREIVARNQGALGRYLDLVACAVKA